VNAELYAIALKTALTEIKNVCPEISNSLFLMNNGSIIAGEEQTIDPNLEKAVSSLQDLTEKTACIGGLDDLSIDGENGKIYVSRINDMYFITALSRKTDLSNLRTITGVILPTIIKVLDSISPEATSPPTLLEPAPRFPSTPLKSMPSEPIAEEENVEETEETVEKIEEPETPEPQELEAKTEEEVESETTKQVISLPSQQFIVDKFGGFMVRSDTVQIDSDVLQRWSSMLDEKEISEIDLETFSGKTARCKTKATSDQKFEGRGLIRIPEKLCVTLELKRGELVRVKPVAESE
jgi:predicted regulator of Ras-like GTPase activity (Roadblock/LC7/MglB family)